MQHTCGAKTTILKSQLCSYNVFESAFHVCATPTRFKDYTFCLFKQNKIYWGPLPTLTQPLVAMIKDSALKLWDLDMNFVSTKFRRTRKLVVIQLNLDAFMINTSEVFTLLKAKVTRKLLSGSLIIREVEIDTLISLLDFIGSGDILTYRKKAEVKQVCNINRTKKNVSDIQRNYRSKVKYLTPRPEHTTKAVEYSADTIRSNRMLLTGTTDNQRTIKAYPLHTQEHNKPKFPQDRETGQSNARETRPVQATEIDTGELSIGAYSSPDRSSLFSMQNYETGIHTSSLRNVVVSGTGLRNTVEQARYPHYLTKEERLATFHTTQWSIDKPQPGILAEWGFFFTGNQDLVRCYQCGIGLKDWIKEDDVMIEHVKHSATCYYLLNKLGKENVDQIKTALDNPGASNSAQLPYKIRSPRYQTMESRLSSFKNFPGHIRISHQQLAVSGLFFTGNGDLCRCFTCDGGLKDWSTGDDPVKEHATYFPKCSYINQLKGTEYVEAIQRSRSNHQTRGATGRSNSTAQETQTADDLPLQNLTIQNSEFIVTKAAQNLGYAETDVVYAKSELDRQGKLNPTADEIINVILDMHENTEMTQSAESSVSNESDVTDIRAIAEENNRLSQMVHCMLCVTGEADILFLPCAHHRTCHKCSVAVSRCPVCDRFIQEKVKTFRS